MFLSVVCAEDMPRITADDIAREIAGRFIGSAMFETRMKPCAFWPRGTVDGRLLRAGHVDQAGADLFGCQTIP